MTPARLRWGLILVQIGILILLLNIEAINKNFVLDLLYAFPLFLIAIGIEKIFTRSRLEFISYVTVCAMFLGGLWVAYEGSATDGNLSWWDKTTYKERYDPTVTALHAVLELGRGDLTVRDATDAIVYGKFAEFTAKPRIRYEVQDNEATVEFAGSYGRFLDGAIRIDADWDNDWTLYFCRSVPLKLECYGENSDIHLNLATTPLRKLDLEADDADIYVKIGDLERLVEITLDGADSDLRLRLPEGSGVKIDAGDFASYFRRIGLVEQDGAYLNDGYDSMANKIKIDLDERIDNLKIEFY
jgi:hypothetical protein